MDTPTKSERKVMPLISAKTLQMCIQMIDTVNLNAGMPNFEEAFESIVTAKKELQAYLKELG